MKRSAERHALILDMVGHHGYVSIEAMAERCGTSVQTVRRDLAELSDRGQVVRYHGGARLPEQAAEGQSFERRNSSNAQAKARACELLLDVVPDGASVFLAGGSTLAIAADALRARERLRIVTNNMHAAMALYDRVGFDVFVAGGWLRTASGSLVGDDAAAALERFSLDFAVLSASGMTLAGDLLEHDESLLAPARAMIRSARERILVLDGSKFADNGIVRGSHLRDMDYLLADREPPAPFRQAIEESGVALRLPGGVPA